MMDFWGVYYPKFYKINILYFLGTYRRSCNFSMSTVQKIKKQKKI